MREITRAAVLGSGVMGSAIAAHLANCGIPCLMLDIVPPDASQSRRNTIAEAGKRALLKAKPSPLYLPANADLIETGNFEDDLHRIRECDWVVEAVREDPEIKRALFKEVSKHWRPGTIVSTNTSGVPLHSLTPAMSDGMARHFLGTHFFNPPRYLKLLEIIPGPHTDVEIVAAMAAFGENILGKGVVYAKDTPNFIANRILTFTFQYIMHEMTRAGLTVDDVDALTGPIIGHASSATFRTADLVGLDTYLHVVENVRRGCPNDERRDVLDGPPWLLAMVEAGLLGAKSGAGFYKRTKDRDAQGKPVIHRIDVDTLDYVPQRNPEFDCLAAAKKASTLEERARIMHTASDTGAHFVWRVFANTAVYAANRLGEIAGDIFNIDNAVKWGFAWEIGLFETWDALGVRAVCERMAAEGIAVPPVARALLDAGHDSFYTYRDGLRQFFDLATNGYRPVAVNAKTLVLTDVKRGGSAVVQGSAGCSLLDIGDGILCAEFHSKMNSIDGAMLDMLREGAELVNEGRFDGLIVANQGPHFSAGANLKVMLDAIEREDWDALDAMIVQFQQSLMALRFCRGPVVAAPHHYTFGGGMETCLHAARVVAAGETYGGLVEAGVGLIPAGGGTKESLRRALAFAPESVAEADPAPYVRRAFETIAMAKSSTSGPELATFGLLSPDDVIEVNFDHQVRRAKDVCRALVLAGYRPPRPALLTVLGEPFRAALNSTVYQWRLAGYASEHDALIAAKLAYVLTGGARTPGTKMTEQDVLDLEREAFVSLCQTEQTKERIEHMLATGKPLRN